MIYSSNTLDDSAGNNNTLADYNELISLDVEIENIVTNMTWDFASDPTRFDVINMDIYWPELPEKRVKSVERAAHKCTIHTTIKDCVEINVRVFNHQETVG